MQYCGITDDWDRLDDAARLVIKKMAEYKMAQNDDIPDRWETFVLEIRDIAEYILEPLPGSSDSKHKKCETVIGVEAITSPPTPSPQQ